MTFIEAVKDAAKKLHRKTIWKLQREQDPYKHIWSRGRELVACTADGRHTYNDYWEWDGTLKDIHSCVKEFTEEYPDDPATEVWLECGYDGTNAALRDKNDEYDPWIDTWDLLLWQDGEYVTEDNILEQIEQHFPKKVRA